MWFDAWSALAEIQGRETRRANQHNEDAALSDTLSVVANVAFVAATVPLKAVTRPSDGHRVDLAIMAAKRAGNRAPSSIATTTGLGATAAYQALARMQTARHLAMSANRVVFALFCYLNGARGVGATFGWRGDHGRQVVQ